MTNTLTSMRNVKMDKMCSYSEKDYMSANKTIYKITEKGPHFTWIIDRTKPSYPLNTGRGRLSDPS